MGPSIACVAVQAPREGAGFLFAVERLLVAQQIKRSPVAGAEEYVSTLQKIH